MLDARDSKRAKIYKIFQKFTNYYKLLQNFTKIYKKFQIFTNAFTREKMLRFFITNTYNIFNHGWTRIIILAIFACLCVLRQSLIQMSKNNPPPQEFCIVPILAFHKIAHNSNLGNISPFGDSARSGKYDAEAKRRLRGCA
jgi:hypothetical protein